MLKWLDAKEVDEFSDWFTKELCRCYPPTGLDKDVRKSTARLKRVHRSLFVRVAAFAREHDLNVYKKARLGNRIKWALREAGYPPQFADTFTHEVITVISVVEANQAKNSPRP